MSKMNKQEFLSELRCRLLEFLPPDETEERLLFYGEMIDDRREDGLSEEDAVECIGSVDDIVSQIASELPLSKLVKANAKHRSHHPLKAWEIVLLALGSPVWLPLLLAAAAVIFAAFVTIWAIVIAIAASAVCIAGCSISLIAFAIVSFVQSAVWRGGALFGAGLAAAGISILIFFGFRQLAKCIPALTRTVTVKISSFLVGRRAKHE